MAVLPDHQLYAWRHNPLSPSYVPLKFALHGISAKSKFLAVDDEICSLDLSCNLTDWLSLVSRVAR